MSHKYLSGYSDIRCGRTEPDNQGKVPLGRHVNHLRTVYVHRSGDLE